MYSSLRSFIGFFFSTQKRVAIVQRNGTTEYFSQFCYECIHSYSDDFCDHHFFIFDSRLFAISQRKSMYTMFHELWLFDRAHNNTWRTIFGLTYCNYCSRTSEESETSQDIYPHLNVHVREDCAYICMLGKSGNAFSPNNGSSGLKVLKLTKGTPHNTHEEGSDTTEYEVERVDGTELRGIERADGMGMQVNDEHVPLYNTGARKCHIRTTCTEHSIIAQPVVPADDGPFEPEIFYFSGPLYKFDIESKTWKEFPPLNTPTKSQELNPDSGNLDKVSAKEKSKEGHPDQNRKEIIF